MGHLPKDQVSRMKIMSSRGPFVLLIGLLSLFASAIAPLVPSAAAAQNSRDEREASNQAVHISELEAQGRFSRIYSLMHSDSKAIVPREAVVGWYETDVAPLEPQPMNEILEVRFVRWTWGVTGERYRNTAEIDFIQPFGSGNNVTYTEETIRLVEEDGEWRWFFGRSREFVDEQIARFVDDDSATQESDRDGEDDRISRSDDDDDRNTSSDEGLPGSTRNCTLVELYPGYPGYRGNITGVMPHWGGTGDYVCLQDLEASDRRFDKDDEDRANKRAARTLGINGTFEDWTWENWMLIEAERELPSSCYTCLILDTSTAPLNRDVQPETDDPRLLLGFWGERVAIDRITEDLFGQPSYDADFYGDDYILRAEGYFLLGATANAPELLEAMTDRVNEVNQPRGSLYSYEQTVDVILSQGGYMWVTGDMSPFDQQFVAVYAFSVCMQYMPSVIGEPLLINFMALIDDWRLTGYRGSLRDYLNDNWNP